MQTVDSCSQPLNPAVLMLKTFDKGNGWVISVKHFPQARNIRSYNRKTGRHVFNRLRQIYSPAFQQAS
jgi:hypothetical protein